MLMVLFFAPLALLCFYLASLCYWKARYRHTLILALIGLCLLMVTLGLLGAGYFMAETIRAEVAFCGGSASRLTGMSQVFAT